MLLEVMALTTDVGDDFISIGKTNLGNFTQSGVRLLRCAGINLQTNATTLWTVVECRRLRLGGRLFPTLADELVNGGHNAVC